MEYISNSRLASLRLVILPPIFSLLFSACGGSGGGGDDDSNGGADTTIAITETFNLNAGGTAPLSARNHAVTSGSGISKIILASAASPQPDNGYTASTIDILNTATNSVAATVDFASNNLATNATATQLAAFFELQSNDLDSSASTAARLTLSTPSIAFIDQFSVNGSTITGNTRSEVMANIDVLPNIVASIDNNGKITVIATNGNDLRLNLNNPAVGQTVGIESLLISINGTVIIVDSQTIGSGQPNTKATIGGEVKIALNYPLQLANPGNGNIFSTTISHNYAEENNFDINDPTTYNDASSIAINDSLGNSHTLTQYFARKTEAGAVNANLWAMYVLIDGRNVGPNDTNGNPTLAAFDVPFDSNGQLDTASFDGIEISRWVPLDSSGNPSGAVTARITIDIAGSTQFGGPFSVTNVTVD